MASTTARPTPWSSAKGTNAHTIGGDAMNVAGVFGWKLQSTCDPSRMGLADGGDEGGVAKERRIVTITDEEVLGEDRLHPGEADDREVGGLFLPVSDASRVHGFQYRGVDGRLEATRRRAGGSCGVPVGLEPSGGSRGRRVDVNRDKGCGVSRVGELGSIGELDERVVRARHRNLHVEIALERNTLCACRSRGRGPSPSDRARRPRDPSLHAPDREPRALPRLLLPVLTPVTATETRIAITDSSRL